MTYYIMKQIFDFIYSGEVNGDIFNTWGNIKFILSKYFLILLTYILIAILLAFLGVLSSNGEVTVEHAKKIPTIVKIFLVCLFVPIIEELIFRLPLISSKINIIVSLFCFTIFLYFFTRKYFISYEYFKYFFISVFFIGCMYFPIFKYEYVHNILTGNKVFMIHFYSILFCIAHFGNYNFNSNTFTPYLISLSVLINGYYFSYIRLRFGIEYSIFIHMFHNTLVSIPMIIKYITK